MTTVQDPWHSVTDFPALAAAMEQFLRGQIPVTPMHGGPLDPESAPLVPHLVALARHGLVPLLSQPGVLTPTLQQRACVDMVVEHADTGLGVVRALAHTDLVVLVAAPGTLLHQDLPMTWSGGDCITWAGRVGLDRQLWADALPSEAADLVARLCFVQVLDPVWGRPHHLWDRLHEAVASLRLRRVA